MKAIILCAGLGTRLRPLTFTRAKHLLPLANKAVIDFAIDSLKDAGARDIGVIVSAESWPIIEEALGDGGRFGVNIEYIEQKEPKGLAHAASCAEEFVDGDDFIMYLGDNLIPEGLGGLMDAFATEGSNAAIMLKEVDDPRAFGIAVLEGEKIVRLVEKPKDPPSNLAIVGAYVFDSTIFDSIRQIEPSWRGEYEITDAIQKSIDLGLTVRPYTMQSWWKDTGRPEDILAANRAVLDLLETSSGLESLDADSTAEGIVHVGTGCTIEKSALRGPVHIADGVTVRGAELGPYVSIGAKSRIEDSIVSDSVVLEECVVENVRTPIDATLLGAKTEIRGNASTAPRLSMILSDQCKVEVS